MDTELGVEDQVQRGRESLGRNSYRFPKTKNKLRSRITLATAG